ncbi:hypothetical protein GCM10025883_34950 [Mobilicoccus caccae]|uniref:DinB-like domain-containing protein n=2 Tax=Mobilicoccus caccae TaxID=1859295 RepID=A0ABQ6IU42_9MICO|nr:hypothetical protein GCM10025883_34950 [Mobilicoccus caccae]
MEVLAHGWDLATAAGLPAEAPAEIAEAGLAAARATLPAEPRGMANGVPFDAVVEPAADAGPTERLANWLGRVSRSGAQVDERLRERRMSGMDLTQRLLDQLEFHWDGQLRPRLEGLTDEEYFWEPVPGCWTVRPRGTGGAAIQGGGGDFTIDFEFPPPTPEPVTTIAWRLGHLIVGCLGVRVAAHFGGPPCDYMSFDYAGDAAGALAQLDDVYARWRDGVRGLDEDALAQPVGEAEGDWAEHPMIELVLHINREVIHHGAEIALLRDLYAHRRP